MRNIVLACMLLFLSFTAFGQAAITGPSNVCTGSAITLADATSGGTWTSSDISVATAGSTSGVVNGVSAGTVTITYDIGTSYVTSTVTVDASPAAITGSHSFCNYMMTSTLSDVTPGGTWNAGSSTTVSVSSVGVLTHMGTCSGGCGTAAITYTLPSGCATNFIVTVDPIVVVYTPPICIGTTGTCNGTPAGGTWTSSNPAAVTVGSSSGIITGIAAGTTDLEYNYAGCTLGGPYTVSNAISAHHVNNLPDTNCNGPDLYITACLTSSAYSVTTWYGDGQSESLPFGSTATLHMLHNYAFPGTYLIKQLVYDGTTAKDSISFSYEYNYCRTLPIKIYNDINHDCVFNAFDAYSYLPVTIRVDSNGIPVDTVAGTSGIYYKAFGPPGTIYSFRIITLTPGMSLTCPSSGVIYDTIGAYVNTYAPKYFGVDCSATSGFDLTQYTSAICGRHRYECNVMVENNYCTTTLPVLTMNFTGRYNFVSAYPPPSSVAGRTATWTIGGATSLSALPPMINVHLEAPIWLTPGDTIHNAFTVTPITGDINPGNNDTIRVDTVKASYDPNQVQVVPAGSIPAGTELQYTINFENDGNDTAQNIYVMDTVSDYLDMNSMKIIAASAVMNTAPFKIGGNNVIKFDFPGIKLLDSSHHNQCGGFVIYKVKTRADLPIGTTIYNHAGIFFDDNPVVMTNTVNDIITAPAINSVSTFENGQVELYPNPVTHDLYVKTTGNYTTCAIINSVGQVLLQQPLSGPQTTISLGMLPSGLYYISVKGESGVTMQKFIKE